MQIIISVLTFLIKNPIILSPSHRHYLYYSRLQTSNENQLQYTQSSILTYAVVCIVNLQYSIFSQIQDTISKTTLLFYGLLAFNVCVDYCVKKNILINFSIFCVSIMSVSQAIFMLYTIFYPLQNNPHQSGVQSEKYVSYAYLWLILSTFECFFFQPQSTLFYEKIQRLGKIGKILMYHSLFVLLIYFVQIYVDVSLYKKQFKNSHHILFHSLSSAAVALILKIVVDEKLKKLAVYEEQMQIRRQKDEQINKLKKECSILQKQIDDKQKRFSKIQKQVFKMQQNQIQRRQIWQQYIVRKQELQAAKGKENKKNYIKPQKLQEKQMCVICLVSQKKYINTKCGHLSLCKECSEKVNGCCPLCRKDGTYIKVYQ